MDIADIRINVAARVEAADDTVRADILSESGIHDDLVHALDIITAPVVKRAGDGSASFGHRIFISSLKSDHHDDRDLGLTEEQVEQGVQNHGHTNGWSCDIAEVDGHEIAVSAPIVHFVSELLAKNKYITKVGTIDGLVSRPDLQDLANQHGVLLFSDPGTGPHIHIQSA